MSGHSPGEPGGTTQSAAAAIGAESQPAQSSSWIKNLDTGEYMPIDAYMDQLASRTATTSATAAMPLVPQHQRSDTGSAGSSGQPGQDHQASSSSFGVSPKGWRKGSTKLSAWAKNTISSTKTKINAIQERVEKRVEETMSRRMNSQDAASSGFGSSFTNPSAGTVQPSGRSGEAAERMASGAWTGAWTAGSGTGPPPPRPGSSSTLGTRSVHSSGSPFHTEAVHTYEADAAHTSGPGAAGHGLQHAGPSALGSAALGQRAPAGSEWQGEGLGPGSGERQGGQQGGIGLRAAPGAGLAPAQGEAHAEMHAGGHGEGQRPGMSPGMLLGAEAAAASANLAAAAASIGAPIRPLQAGAGHVPPAVPAHLAVPAHPAVPAQPAQPPAAAHAPHAQPAVQGQSPARASSLQQGGGSIWASVDRPLASSGPTSGASAAPAPAPAPGLGAAAVTAERAGSGLGQEGVGSLAGLPPSGPHAVARAHRRKGSTDTSASHLPTPGAQSVDGGDASTLGGDADLAPSSSDSSSNSLWSVTGGGGDGGDAAALGMAGGAAGQGAGSAAAGPLRTAALSSGGPGGGGSRSGSMGRGVRGSPLATASGPLDPVPASPTQSSVTTLVAGGVTTAGARPVAQAPPPGHGMGPFADRASASAVASEGAGVGRILTSVASAPLGTGLSASGLALGPLGSGAVSEPRPLGLPVRVYHSRSSGTHKLGHVRQVQRLQAHDGVVWAAALNRDGDLLATGGQDTVVRVWRLLKGHRPQSASSSLSARTKRLTPTAVLAAMEVASSQDLDKVDSPFAGISDGSGTLFQSSVEAVQSQPFITRFEPVIDPEPDREFEGHTEDVLDVTWSKGNLLLSASVDRTVRLWHMDEYACLRVFQHPDIVTSVRFHPGTANLFATGCADGRVRMWEVASGKALAAAAIPQDMITAVSFTQDSQRLVVGTLKGVVRFYKYYISSSSLQFQGSRAASIAAAQVSGSGARPAAGLGSRHPAATGDKLESLGQLDVKDLRSSASAAGSKVTGLLVLPHPTDDCLIVTSGDSRLRRYLGFAQHCKYKGLKAQSTLLRASLSLSGQQLLCGSEDGRVYMWDVYMPGEQKPSAPGAEGPAAAGDRAGGGQQAPNRAASLSSHSESPRPVKPLKNTACEAFATDEQTVTVALMAPEWTWRLGPTPSTPSTPPQRGGSFERVGTTAWPGGGAALGQGAAATGGGGMHGALFVVAGFSGCLVVYENQAPWPLSERVGR